jgi:hypothetical protein
MMGTVSRIRRAASVYFKPLKKKNAETHADLPIDPNGYEPLKSDMIFTDCKVFPGTILAEEDRA